MVNPDVASYIKNAKEAKMSDEQIREGLTKNGWSSVEIDEALGITTPNNQPIPPVKPNSANSHGMWDAFEHILLFISLYVLASAIALSLHIFVDKWFPGVATDTTSFSDSFADNTDFLVYMLRAYIAALIVSFPLFLFFFLDITRRTMHDATIRNLRSRKVLIYITLIITFLIMLGHIIYLIYAFLSGNVTLNLLLHLVVTFFVNGVVFAYYLLQVKQDRRVNV